MKINAFFNHCKSLTLLAIVLMTFFGSVNAATYVVTNFNDHGNGSLRQAIADANATPEVADTITFQTEQPGTILLTTGALTITDRHLMILGTGSTVLSISGNHTTRLLNIDQTAATVVIQDLAMIDGGNPSGESHLGIGIVNNGGLALNRVMLAHHQNCDSVVFNTGTLALSNVTIENNECSAMSNSGTLYAEQLVLHQNVSATAGTLVNNGNLHLLNSLVYANHTDTSGGALSQYNGVATIYNTTLSDNSANHNGGAINLLGGSVEIINSTIVNNTALELGGGIANDFGYLILGNTLIADNHAVMGAQLGSPNDFGAVFFSKGYNLVSLTDANSIKPLAVFSLATTDIPWIGTAAELYLPLADNGGLSQTHALAANSLAIDSGNNDLIPVEVTTDQRGIEFLRTIAGIVDIGAFETGNEIIRLQHSLMIDIKGEGRVVSSENWIDCPDVCSTESFTVRAITLTAMPMDGWSFQGWGGLCTGTADCAITINKTAQVTANFVPITDLFQLDSPVNGSSESGIGIVHGWVCAATQISIQIDELPAFQAAYGANRSDSQVICQDTNNGFAAAINWSEYGSGNHRLKLIADGQELTTATVTVTALDNDYLSGLTKTTTVIDFPVAGQQTRLNWSEVNQNFVVNTTNVAYATRTASRGNWEGPVNESTESGQALIRGWVCDATAVSVTIDDMTPLFIPYGSERNDTIDICGDNNNGYALAINWSELPDGIHHITLMIDGAVIDTRTFSILTPGGNGTITGIQKQHTITDFPNVDDQITVQWSEPHQSFRIVNYQAGHANEKRDQLWKLAEIYIATLGYAPDNEGLQYWKNNLQTNAWTLTTVAQAFFDNEVVQQLYPLNTGDALLIDALYQNIFGRAPDTAGKNYWLSQLETGTISRNAMIIALIEGGWNNRAAAEDMARFNNRVQVGLAFATQQAQRGIVYQALTESQQILLRTLGQHVLMTVTADDLTRDAAIASIPILLEMLAF